MDIQYTIPFADQSMHMPTKGTYRKWWPEGLVIHFTAGSDNYRVMEEGAQKGYCYMYLSREGKLYQPAPINKYGAHAGPSEYPGLGKGVSQYLAGVEVACWGPVSKFPDGLYRPDPKAWGGRTIKAIIPEREVRVVDGQAWQMYTQRQEEVLQRLVVWLHNKGPVGVFKLDYVVGHEEVAVPRGRKVDPGGSLGMKLPEYRAYLKTVIEG